MGKTGVYLIAVVTLACLCPDGPRADDAALNLLARANADFGYDLYREIRARDGNLCISPYSLSAALSTAYLGARTTTQREMAAVMHLTGDNGDVQRRFSELRSHIDSIGQRGDVELRVACSLWVESGRALLDGFLKAFGNGHGAELRRVDFGADPDGARAAINAWAEERTNGKLRGLVPEGLIDASTALVICDALHFKGDWDCGFDRSNTVQRDFYVEPGRPAAVPMMFGRIDVRLGRYGDVEAIELPYDGDDLAMVILMPGSVGGLEALEARLTEETVSSLVAELRAAQRSPADVGIPRFEVSSDLELAEVLAEMGMASAFHSADFSGIDGTRELFVSEVLHSATLRTDEDGAEGAASSAPVMKKGGAAFIADRPFVFLVIERRTGSILFLGRVADPIS